MKKVILILICILFLIIDNSILPFFAFKGVSGSLLFVFALAISINSNKWDAITIGVISGIFQDLYFSGVVGINPLINMVLCLICSYLGESIFKNKRIVPVAVAFFGTLIKYIAICIIFYSIGLEISIMGARIMCIYNAVIMAIMYKMVYKLSKKDIMKEPWSFYR